MTTATKGTDSLELAVRRTGQKVLTEWLQSGAVDPGERGEGQLWFLSCVAQLAEARGISRVDAVKLAFGEDDIELVRDLVGAQACAVR